MAPDRQMFRPLRIGDHTFQCINWNAPEVEARVVAEMEGGIDVYYDRLWPLTLRFCEFLLEQPTLLARRNVLVVGAGVGMEAVIAGHLGRRLWINDRAPGALELLGRQLEANGIRAFESLPGSFADVPLPAELETVLASFVVYDEETRESLWRLLESTASRGIPLILANQEIGGHLGRLLQRASTRLEVDTLLVEDPLRILCFH